MLGDFGALGLFFIFAFLFAGSLPAVNFALRVIKIAKHKPDAVKNDTYECGMRTIGRTWVQFNFRYYFFALLFVLLDILAIFLYPWAVSLRVLGVSGFLVMLIFVAIITVGYLYAWKKKALEWQ